MSIYSTLLFAGSSPGPSSVVFPVPAASTVVVRDIEMFVAGSGVGFVNVLGEVSGSQVLIYTVQNPTALQWHQWQGRAVIPGGGALMVGSSAAGAASLYISGYLLSD